MQANNFMIDKTRATYNAITMNSVRNSNIVDYDPDTAILDSASKQGSTSKFPQFHKTHSMNMGKRLGPIDKTQNGSPFREYKLSVSETVKLGSKKHSQLGIEGYELKKWHQDINKPIVYKIHPEQKPKHFLDDVLRQKKDVPPPNTYNINRELSIKQNMMHAKSPRVTMVGEIQKTQKKNSFPEPASYKLSTTLIDRRPKGCFNFKSDRNGYIEECYLIGKNSPLVFDKQYSQVDPNPKYPKCYKPPEKKPLQKSSLSPTSYEPSDSFKNSQLVKPKFYISKYKYENYISAQIKQKKWVPGSGAYDTDKGKNIITKGASKGWK
uniref:Uncharacterized protein n=1 Tax=Strombidium rassoulzadegani TaxID=1082188 RepID=A0A7S3FZ33_9SPIT|mmetsp:Transcript_8338/g.13950  ORF Transcript_8338/g.13950 Transcript_8338/m.13950 type:complete len:323 (+) Transcript_8338:266-1234(+)